MIPHKFWSLMSRYLDYRH
ncbi:hypothetical protein CP8484711_1313A, partial [Chlamydia psittaci 84-8471/1]